VPTSLKEREAQRSSKHYQRTASTQAETANAAGNMIRPANVRLTHASAAPVAFTETLFLVIEGSRNDASNQPVYQIQLWRVMVLHPVVDPNNSRTPAKQT
jgi:hypothetical protein